MEALTETVKVIVEKVVGYAIGAVARQMGYLIHFKRNVDKLRNEVVYLEDARKSVERKVEAAEDNLEEIEDKVLTWLKRIETVTEETQEFFKEEDQAKLKCLNLKARYQLGKRAHKMGLAIKELKGTADTFDTVGHRVPMRGGTTISTKGYEEFDSRKSTLNGIMRDLKDDSIRAIGVYGMGGVGKTMLVEKIATKAKEDRLFERIVKVVVSQTPDLEKIQKDIAKELGLRFQDETDSQKADLLRERLKNGKILLIIDDIWNQIDLESRGISFGDDQKKSKLLLTSRFRDVLGTDMDTQEIFSVGALSDEEAKYLFSKIVGDLVENLNFQSIMVELVKECAGLPIAITIVANALKSKRNPNVWEDAVRQLKRANPTQIKDMHEKVYSSIKLSYDFLTKEAQSLFLFCSIFEEDKVMEIDLLRRYLVGLDFFEDVYKMEEVKNRVHTLVNSLKDSCLLLEGDRSGTFKMHDVIRDVAIYVADKDGKMLTIRSLEGPEIRLNMKKWEDSFGIALFDVDFKELPETFECPQLKFFFLGNKKYYSNWFKKPPIPNIPVEGMKELRVLALINASLPHLSSISCLHNLQSLFLDGCELEDVALIGELKNLRALTLSRSNIKQLPMEIRQLTRLQLLNLNYCTELEIIPSNVFSDLRRLEELYMNHSFNQWRVDGEITERNNTRVSELDHMPFLTTLYIHFPYPKILPKTLLFENLKRYEILIGNNWNWYSDSDRDYDEFKNSRNLKLELDRSLQIEDGIKVLLKSCEYLDLYLRNLPNWVGFHPDADFQLLFNEKHVWTSNPETILTFQKLRKVEVSQCKTLKSLFPISVAKSLEQLKSLHIDDCELMEEIVALEEGLETTTEFVFPRITSLSLKLLPELKCFYPGKHTSEWPSLKELAICKCNKVRIVASNELSFPNTDGLGHRVPVQQPLLCVEKHVWTWNLEAILTFQNLLKVEVSQCKTLKSLFPDWKFQSWWPKVLNSLRVYI